MLIVETLNVKKKNEEHLRNYHKNSLRKQVK